MNDRAARERRQNEGKKRRYAVEVSTGVTVEVSTGVMVEQMRVIVGRALHVCTVAQCVCGPPVSKPPHLCDVCAIENGRDEGDEAGKDAGAHHKLFLVP